MFEKLLAGLTLAVCLALLLRLALPARRRQRFDAAAGRAWEGARRGWARLRRFGVSPYRWWRVRKDAARVAEETIRRARERGSREDNVYRPESFRGPPKDR